MIIIPDNIDSKYRFVILSALRARQLQGGSMPLIKDSLSKSTHLARKELQAGLVKFQILEKRKPAPAAEPVAQDE